MGAAFRQPGGLGEPSRPHRLLAGCTEPPTGTALRSLHLQLQFACWKTKNNTKLKKKKGKGGLFFFFVPLAPLAVKPELCGSL